jgi:hypothetical protein
MKMLPMFVELLDSANFLDAPEGFESGPKMVSNQLIEDGIRGNSLNELH